MALPISLGKFRLHTLIHTFPLESLLPNIVVTSIRSELNISAMYVESQSFCYVCGVPVIKGLLLSLFHIFTNAINYFKLEVQLPPDIRPCQPKQKLRA
jgi:hypothetical protein